MPPKQKAKNKAKQKQKQKQKQTQSIVVNIGKNRSTGRKRLPPQPPQPQSIPSIIQLPQQHQQPDYSSILTAMMQHQTRTLSQKEPIINNLTPIPTPISTPTQTAESQTPAPQIQASPNQQLTQQQRRVLSSAAAERRAGNTASNFQAQPSSLAPPPSTSPPPAAAEAVATQAVASLSQSPVEARLATPDEARQATAAEVRPGANYYHERIVDPLKGEPAAAEAAAEPEKKAKAAKASKIQNEEKTNFMKSIGMKLDKGEPLSQAEISRLMSNKTLGKKIKEKLISKGYGLFEIKI
jgi:hypothetical protein